MKPRHLPNAPILEAVIDIRVAGAKVTDEAEFRAVHDRVRQEYPGIDEIRTFQATFPVDQAGAHNVAAGAKDLGSAGIRFLSADKKQIVQFRRDGYTFSRLAPYTSWKQIRKESSTLWKEYLRIAQPAAATRVALRYINKLDLPPPSQDLSDFLTTPPQLPKGIPATISGFFHRTSVDCVNGKFKGWITQAVEPSSQAGGVTVYLDFDVAREGTVPIGDEIEATLNEIRDIKNAMFFSSVTKKTVEMYE